MCDLCDLELAQAEGRPVERFLAERDAAERHAAELHTAERHTNESHAADRRRFLTGAAAATAALAVPAAAASAGDMDNRVRRLILRERHHREKAHADSREHGRPDVRQLGFVNLHTGEKVRATYHANGEYIAGALDELDSVMRDVRNDDIKRMDRRVFDLLHDLKRHFGSSEDYLLISGYRSPETNNWLRGMGRGVAKRSYHMRGMATDVRLPGVDVVRFAYAARSMKRGGVGLYRRSRFVHVDVARPRHWNF